MYSDRPSPSGFARQRTNPLKAESERGGPYAKRMVRLFLCDCVLFILLHRGQRGLCGGQAGDGDAEGRAAYIVEADLVAELDALGIAAMFAADAELQGRIRSASLLGGHLHELAHAFAVERLERIDLKDLDLLRCARLIQSIHILQQELALGVVAAEAKGRLGKVVGAEAKELRHLRDLVGGQGRARQLDHRAKLILDG